MQDENSRKCLQNYLNVSKIGKIATQVRRGSSDILQNHKWTSKNLGWALKDQFFAEKPLMFLSKCRHRTYNFRDILKNALKYIQLIAYHHKK